MLKNIENIISALASGWSASGGKAGIQSFYQVMDFSRQKRDEDNKKTHSPTGTK